MNRNFLKEAIADAKAVKESAIANAKAALEESFTPHLKTMLAAKLYEMEEKEMDDVKEEYDELEEAKEETTESEEGTEMEEGKEMEEPASEMNLDELLAELEEVDEPTNEELYEAEEAEEDEETVGEIPVSKLESIIADVIQDMMDSGELEKKGESEEEESEEESKEEVDEELEEILAEIELEEKKHNKEEESSKLDEFLAEIDLEEDETEEVKETSLGYAKMSGGDYASYCKENPNDPGCISESKKMKNKKDELEEAYAALKTVKAELNEVNLLNAKLLYTNKIFRSKSLTESQKVKVLTAFDKAINVKEVKLVYESLLENLTTTKKSVNENLLSSASKTISGIKNTKQPIVESNEMVKRFQKLAGIK